MQQATKIPRPQGVFNRKDKIYMRMALEVAKASKCLRAKYGAIIVSADDRVVATAYNGKPRGAVNDAECYRLGLKPGAQGPACCIHSEANAILFCSQHDMRGATLYVSGLPCHPCMLLVANSGISRVVALRDGHNYEGIDRMGLYGLNHVHHIMNYEDLT
jgi:dCMP deaminase